MIKRSNPEREGSARPLDSAFAIRFTADPAKRAIY